MSRQEKILLFLLACLNFTHIMDFMIMMPMGPMLMRYFSISPQQFSFLVSAYSLSAGTSGFLAAFFVDRFDRKKVILTAYTGFIVGTLACGLAPTYELLTAARLLAGLFGGMIGAQVLSIVGDTFAYERRAQAMSIVMTAFSVASVVGVPLGLYMASSISWHAPFLLVGALGVVIIGLIFRFVPPLDKHIQSQDTRHNPLDVITQILNTPNQYRALLLSVVIMLGHFSIIPFISPYLVANVGFSEKDLYLIYLVGGALTIFTAPVVGRIADKQGKLPVFVVFAVLSTIPIYLITNMATSSMVFILFTSGLFFIFSNGRLIPTQAMVSGVVLPQQRGSFMSINSSLQLLSQSVAVYMAGLVIEKLPGGQLLHYNWVGYAAIVLLLASILVARTVKPIQ